MVYAFNGSISWAEPSGFTSGGSAFEVNLWKTCVFVIGTEYWPGIAGMKLLVIQLNVSNICMLS